ncbi:MAG: zincin-like metallopeptidase domain-containing protein [Singulisphaera sp.]
MIEAEKLGLRGTSADAGQLWLSHDRSEAYFARAMEICEKTGAIVIHSGSQAIYYRPDDRITMPNRKRFPDPAAYFTTRFHEMAHWAEKRVGWTGTYAEGELIAVLASFHLAQAAGMPAADIGRYQEYHVEWLREIQSDDRFLARMLDQADKVARFIVAMGNEQTRRTAHAITQNDGSRTAISRSS